MSRYFEPIKLIDFKLKVGDAFGFGDSSCLDIYRILERLDKDIKVLFDIENFNYTTTLRSKFLGWNNLSNGLVFLGCQVGGDWEVPVSFILYFDGRKIRGYVPTLGNPWNTDTKRAYGNDTDADDTNIRKRWPECPANIIDKTLWVAADEGKIIQDISTHILSRPKGLAPKVSKCKALPAQNTLQQRVEALCYFGDCDEGTELFQSTLCLVYDMYGLGEVVKAETLYLWAKEMADASVQYSNDANTVKGYWGH